MDQARPQRAGVRACSGGAASVRAACTRTSTQRAYGERTCGEARVRTRGGVRSGRTADARAASTSVDARASERERAVQRFVLGWRSSGVILYGRV